MAYITKYSTTKYYVYLSYDFGNTFTQNSSLNFDASNVTNTALTIAPFGQSITVVSGNNSQTSSTYDNIYLWNQSASYSNLPNSKDLANTGITGSSNTVFGIGALSKYLAYGNTGVNNTAIGYNALINNTTGSNNTAVGYYSGFTGSTGSYNTMIGYNAGMVIAGLSGYTGNYNYSTALGYNATITDNNQIVLGTTAEKISIPGSTFGFVGNNRSVTIAANGASRSLGTFKPGFYLFNGFFQIDSDDSDDITVSVVNSNNTQIFVFAYPTDGSYTMNIPINFPVQITTTTTLTLKTSSNSSKSGYLLMTNIKFG